MARVDRAVRRDTDTVVRAFFDCTDHVALGWGSFRVRSSDVELTECPGQLDDASEELDRRWAAERGHE